MKEQITYTGNGQVQIALNDGRIMKVTKGGNTTIKRGDIPDDAYKALSERPDFGGDFEAYRAKRAAKWTKKVEAEKPTEEIALDIGVEEQPQQKAKGKTPKDKE